MCRVSAMPGQNRPASRIQKRRAHMYCSMAFDHEPQSICPACDLPVDESGNTEEDFRYCAYPYCGCDGSRLCMAEQGASPLAAKRNIEGTFHPVL